MPLWKALRLMFETSRKVCRKNRSKCKKVANPPSSAESSREGKGERKRKGEKTGRSSIHLSEIPARSPFSSPILQYICCSRALILKNPGNLCGGERPIRCDVYKGAKAILHSEDEALDVEISLISNSTCNSQTPTSKFNCRSSK